MMTDEQHQHDAETERLWRAISRDLGASVLYASGRSASGDERPMRRLQKNWHKLCEHDLDLAAFLYHGIDQVYMMMGGFGGDEPSPSKRWQEMFGGFVRELTGLADIAEKRFPDERAQARTVGELAALGDRAIQAEIDEETDAS